jgi:ribosome modulation factor
MTSSTPTLVARRRAALYARGPDRAMRSGYAATPATGRSVDTCCFTINFFTHARSAQAWINAHPRLAATILSQDEAVTLGRDIFASLLA